MEIIDGIRCEPIKEIYNLVSIRDSMLKDLKPTQDLLLNELKKREYVLLHDQGLSSWDDFKKEATGAAADFSIEIANKNTDFHELVLVDGLPTHHAWITGSSHINHRAYGCIDLYKCGDEQAKNKVILGPVIWEFEFKYRGAVKNGQWVNIATINNATPTDPYCLPVTVNIVSLSNDYPQIDINHVPSFQVGKFNRLVTKRLPENTWMKFRLEFEYARNGFIRVYIDDREWANAEIKKGPPYQFTGGHLPLYCAPDMDNFETWTRDIKIFGVRELQPQF